jgi:acyl-coenzyme A thioesterase PaaI-like protein
MDPNQAILSVLKERLGSQFEKYNIPPPVFLAMGGEFLAFDLDNGSLKTRFPIRQEYLNPYGAMQGGMIAAAVDNTLGPLSVLVAPPNVTRRLEMKYSRPVTPDLEFIIVTARFIERKGPQLTFNAEVKNPAGDLFAKAKATHWILME